MNVEERIAKMVGEKSLIELYPNNKWNWTVISKHYPLTVDFASKFHSKLKIECLVSNPTITLEIIEQIPNWKDRIYVMRLLENKIANIFEILEDMIDVLISKRIGVDDTYTVITKIVQNKHFSLDALDIIDKWINWESQDYSIYSRVKTVEPHHIDKISDWNRFIELAHHFEINKNIETIMIVKDNLDWNSWDRITKRLHIDNIVNHPELWDNLNWRTISDKIIWSQILNSPPSFIQKLCWIRLSNRGEISTVKRILDYDYPWDITKITSQTRLIDDRLIQKFIDQGKECEINWNVVVTVSKKYNLYEMYQRYPDYGWAHSTLNMHDMIPPIQYHAKKYVYTMNELVNLSGVGIEYYKPLMEVYEDKSEEELRELFKEQNRS